ncbi:MAG: metal ABC transporter permease, partial [Bacilli bacterium]
IAYLLMGTRNSVVMFLGAILFGVLAVFFIQKLVNAGVQSDASIGVVFTALFALGVLLISMYAEHVDLDLDCVLYGEIAYAPWDILLVNDTSLGPIALWQVGFSVLLNVVVIGMFFKQFKVCAFDPALAISLGIPVTVIHYSLMSLVSVTTISAFESVGAILVVGMLVIPPATSYLLTTRFDHMIFIACGIGALSSIVGYYTAAFTDTSIAGCIVGAAGFFFFLALLFSPSHGIITKTIYNRKKHVEI